MRGAVGCVLIAAVFSACGESPAPRPDAVTPTAGLAQLSLDNTSLMGGESAQGTVTLTSAAPAAGVVITLSSSSSSAGVPGTVAVAAGATSATFTVTTQAVQSTTNVTIVASLDAISRPITLTLNPAPPPRLVALDIPPTVVVQQATTGRVVLDRPAPAGGTAVTLSSDDTGIRVPTSAQVPAGETNATFEIFATGIGSGSRIHITAVLGADKFSAQIDVLSGPRSTSSTMSLTSPAGDPLGQGRSGGFNVTTTTFSGVSTCQGGALKAVAVANDGRALVVIMTARRGSTLGLTTYVGAQLYPNQATDRPGLFAQWEGRSCSQIFDAEFTIFDLLLGENGAIRNLRGSMRLRCNSATAPPFLVTFNLIDLPINTLPAQCP